jgi:hypothetical protein
MHEFVWIRYFMVAFFAALGLWLILKRKRFGAAGGYFCFALDEPARSRLRSALERRQASEALPSSPMGASLGALSLVLAALSAASRVPVSLLYAAFVVALAAILTVAYVRVRRLAPRRFATLRVRAPFGTVPAYVRSLAAVAIVSPAMWVPDVPVSAVAVMIAGCAIAGLALSVAAMPAFLRGEDVAVETYVDERLRHNRAIQLFTISVAPSYVFESFTGFTDSRAHFVAWSITFAAFLALFVLQLRSRRGPSQADISVWFHAAS